MTLFTPSPVVLTPILAWYTMMLIVLELTHRRAAGAIQGIKYCMAAVTCLMIAAATVGLRSHMPFYYSIISTNICWLMAPLLIHAGLRAFANRPTNYWLTVGVLLLATIGYYWFTFIDEDYVICVLTTTSCNTIIFLATLADMRKLPITGQAEKLMRWTLILLAAFNMIRAATIILGFIHTNSEIIERLSQRGYMATNAILSFTVTIAFTMMVNSKLQARLTYLGTRDRQTGAYARVAFFELMATELKRVQRKAAPLTFVMVDLDKFKTINDTWGHPVGDKVIADFVANAMSTLRSYDLLGRYGGDEFVILLPNTTKDDAMVVAERIRARCASSSTDGLPPYSISVGLCCTSDGNISMDEFINAADEALYRAKEAGRNRVDGCDYDSDHDSDHGKAVANGVMENLATAH